MELNEKIKKLRRSRGHTQQEFAKALAISTGYLSQIEMGIRLPSRALLKRIADMFGASLDYLLLDAPPLKLPDVPEEIIEFFRSEHLDDHDKEELLSMFEWWREQRNRRPRE